MNKYTQHSSNHKQNSKDGWNYLFKIISFILIVFLIVGFIGAYILVPIKAENKIKKRLSSVQIAYTNVSCAGLFDVSCTIDKIISPTENGFVLIDKLELFSVQELKGLSLKNYSGNVHILAKGYGLSVDQSGLQKEVSSIIKNSFNNSDFEINIELEFLSGVAQRANLKSITVDLPGNNARLSFSVDILDVASQPYFNEAVVSVEFTDYKKFLISLYRSSLVDLTQDEIKQANLKNYNKEVVSNEDIFQSYVSNVKKIAGSNVNVSNKEFYNAVILPDFKGATITFVNSNKTPIKDLVVALATGAPLESILTSKIVPK